MTSSPVHRLPLCDVVSIGGENIDPRKCPTERFALFSIPAFDAGKKPEIISGCEIGSVKRIVRPGDCLFSKLNPRINRVWVVPAAESLRQIATPEFWPLRPKTNVKVLSQYLRFMLSWGPFREAIIGREEAATKSRSRLKPEQLLSKSIPVPPLPEQQRIVNLLDEADELRRRRQQAGRRTADLIPALFDEMFGDPATNPKGWPVVQMRNILEGTPNYGTMIRPRSDSGGWLDIRVANIRNGAIDLSDRKYVDLPASTVLRHEVRVGDLLLARAIGSSEQLGKCIVAYPGEERWAFDSHLMRVRFGSEVAIPEVIRAFLASPGGRRLFLNKTRESAVQFNINVGEFSAICLPLPALPLQREFAARVAEIRALEARQAESRRRLDDLFQSMLHRAFQGEL